MEDSAKFILRSAKFFLRNRDKFALLWQWPTAQHVGRARAQATLLLADEWTLVTFRSPCVDHNADYFHRLPEGKDSPFANDDSQARPGPSPCAGVVG